jgi:hypothetical protein
MLCSRLQVLSLFMGMVSSLYELLGFGRLNLSKQATYATWT